MKLIPLNKENEILKECGYTNPINFDNPNFHGHQKGVAICIINKQTGIIEQNLLNMIKDEKRKEELLQQILESKQILKVVDDITQYENDKLIPKQLFYLPYMVDGHSAYQPTVNYNNISGAMNVHYEIDVEILFVHDEGLNRYITVHFTTQNVSIMDLIYGMFDDEEELTEILEKHGIYYQEEEDEDGKQGYIVDFYDEAGGRYEYCFEGPWGGSRLRDCIASMRLINIEMVYDNEES